MEVNKMGISNVTQFRTDDGKIHPTMSQAIEHEVECIFKQKTVGDFNCAKVVLSNAEAILKLLVAYQEPARISERATQDMPTTAAEPRRSYVDRG
jgi:hypothetical protein